MIVFGSLARFAVAFLTEPLATVTTVLYRGDFLPPDARVRFRGLIREDLLKPDCHVVHIMANTLKMVW